MPSVCQECGGAFSTDAARELIGEYDEIEIPPVKPYIIRHRRFACRCAHCGLEAKAPAPAVATTTPFGPRIHALAIYLKGFQALSYERLRGMFRDAFGLGVSEGALMNMFIRSHPRFKIEAEKAKAILARRPRGRQRRDRRSYRGDELLSLGLSLQGRSGSPARLFPRGARRRRGDGRARSRGLDFRPLFGAAVARDRHQTCLAHLARDTAFALEHGSDDLPFRFKLWLGKAFDLARTIANFAASTAEEKARSGKTARRPLIAATGCDLARELQAKIGRARDQFLTFCDYPGEVDVTNNTSERKLRPCVIQRKVTNGYRAMWAAQAEADVRTTIDTARLDGGNPFDVIIGILA